MKPLEYSELYIGMRIWDAAEQRYQKVLRTHLWRIILEKNPNRFYAHEPGEEMRG